MLNLRLAAALRVLFALIRLVSTLRPCARGTAGSGIAIFWLCGSCCCGEEPRPELKQSHFDTRSRPETTALFTKLDPSAIGLTVQNLYDDPQMWGRRYRAYMGGAMGSGVAAGDFNLDGKVDL